MAALSQVRSCRKARVPSSAQIGSDHDRCSPRFSAGFERGVFSPPVTGRIALAGRRPRPVVLAIAGELHHLPPESRPIGAHLTLFSFDSLLGVWPGAGLLNPTAG